MAAACLRDIDAVVLAGGLGTRIRRVLGGTPKLLAIVGGRPFLDILVARLKQFGARRLVLGLGHRAEKVTAHLEAHPITGMDTVVAVELKPLGTAGALRFLRPHMESDVVLAMNGDSFVGADLCDFVAAHRRSGAQASLLCVEVADARRFGRVDVGADGRVRAFREKDTKRKGAGVVNAGVYLFSRAVLDGIAKMPGESLEKDVFPKLLEGGVNAVVCDAPFVDIGTPAGLKAAAEVIAPFISAPRPSG
ncbi:MAG: NTP transferase domain-containing protein [Rhodospirillales bacterium]|nr:NTP transferase domain-containing protein [Rhodospirillales bacterium]